MIDDLVWKLQNVKGENAALCAEAAATLRDFGREEYMKRYRQAFLMAYVEPAQEIANKAWDKIEAEHGETASGLRARWSGLFK